MEATAYNKNLRISPKKLRFLLTEIKKMNPSEALVRLMYMPHGSAKIFYKSISSAVANAKNILKVDEKLLKFKHLSVEQGNKLKRFKAGGRGTAKPIMRRYSHIKIVLIADEPKVQQTPPTTSPVLSVDKKQVKELPAKNPKLETKTKPKLKIKNKK